MSNSNSSNKKRSIQDMLDTAMPTIEIVSYGLLLYRRKQKSSNNKAGANDDDNDNHDNDPNNIEFLLGLIPQRNWWTVFKGLPNNNKETPYETALREFHEETGTDESLVSEIIPELTLHGMVGSGIRKKKLEIFLQEGSQVTVKDFDIDRVVKIDQGYMKGKPEIVEMRWMTLEQALEGTLFLKNNAKIYKSQENILRQAHEFLLLKRHETVPAATKEKGGGDDDDDSKQAHKEAPRTNQNDNLGDKKK